MLDAPGSIKTHAYDASFDPSSLMRMFVSDPFHCTNGSMGRTHETPSSDVAKLIIRSAPSLESYVVLSMPGCEMYHAWSIVMA